MTIEVLKLRNPSGLEEIDRLLAGMIGLCEMTFPDRIGRYLLLGSYRDGSAVSASDLDVCVIFNESQSCPRV